MNEAQLIGYGVTIVITLGSFIAVIMKFTQPIHDLRIVIQKLNDNIDAMKNESARIEKRVTEHGKEIDKLDNRVGTLETKMDMYHK